MKLMMTKPEQYGMSEKVLRSLSVAFLTRCGMSPSERVS